MGPRIYTASQATGLIPQLEQLFSELDRIRERIRKNKGKIDVLEMIWGDEVQAEGNPDHREYSHYLSEIEQAKKEFESVNRKVADMEVVGKSVEQGIVDFYGVMEGRLVFLCWKRGESAVSFYHHLDEGFQDRKSIPDSGLPK